MNSSTVSVKDFDQTLNQTPTNIDQICKMLLESRKSWKNYQIIVSPGNGQCFSDIFQLQIFLLYFSLALRSLFVHFLSFLVYAFPRIDHNISSIQLIIRLWPFGQNVPLKQGFLPSF